MKNKLLIFGAIVAGVLFIALIAASISFLTDDESSTNRLSAVPAQSKYKHSDDTLKKPVNSPVNKHQFTKKSAKPSDGEPEMTESEKPAHPSHVLTEAQKAETEEEIARMKQELPGNMWIPESPTEDFDNKRADQLRKSIVLSDKIKKGTATRKEQIDYYSIEIKSARDKIDLMRYIAERTKEKSLKNGRSYLTPDDIAHGEEKIMELQELISGYKQKLSDLQNSPDTETKPQ